MSDATKGRVGDGSKRVFRLALRSAGITNAPRRSVQGASNEKVLRRRHGRLPLPVALRPRVAGARRSASDAAARLGERAHLRRRQRAGARDAHALPGRGGGPSRRLSSLAVRPLARRRVEVSLGAKARRAARGLLQAGLRRERVARHKRSLELGDGRLRHAHLHEHHVPLQARRAARDGRAAADLDGVQRQRPRRLLPPHV